MDRYQYRIVLGEKVSAAVEYPLTPLPPEMELAHLLTEEAWWLSRKLWDAHLHRQCGRDERLRLLHIAQRASRRWRRRSDAEAALYEQDEEQTSVD